MYMYIYHKRSLLFCLTNATPKARAKIPTMKAKTPRVSGTPNPSLTVSWHAPPL